MLVMFTSEASQVYIYHRYISLGQEDPLEEEIATHSSTLVRRTPRTEKSVEVQSIGSQTVKSN